MKVTECFDKPLWMKQLPQFIGAFDDLNTLPTVDLPEFAVIGRSNVGKSSLLNAITGFSKLARVSSTPGRTQTLNFFNWDNQIMLVDLPGYGYAKASKVDVQKWQERMHMYLFGRRQLRRVFLLIDSRHGIKDVDLIMMKECDDAGVGYQIVLTKVDKIGQKEMQEAVAAVHAISKKHPAMHPDVLATSSESKCGIDAVLGSISLSA